MDHRGQHLGRRLAAEDRADAEDLARRLRRGGQLADGRGRGVGPQDAAPGKLLVPPVAPAEGAGRPTILVGPANLLDQGRRRQLAPGRAPDVEGVLHVSGRVILGLEERVEVPERRLHPGRAGLLESHLQEGPPGLLEHAAVAEPGERITQGELLELGDALGLGDRRGDVGGDELEGGEVVVVEGSNFKTGDLVKMK